MYLANYTKSDNARTLAQKKARLAALVNSIGPATDISNVTIDQIVDLRDNLLPRLPARDTQLTGAMPYREKADYAGRNGLRLLSVKTQGLYFSEWKAFFRSVPVREILGRHLLEGLSIKGNKFQVVQREGFTIEELNKMFTAPLFTGCAGEAAGDWAKPGKQVIRNSKFWIPLISLFSGMTVSEICDLEKVDVRNQAGMVSLDVRTDHSRNRTVKTKSRVRRVPVHPELIKFGFLEYVEKLAEGPLFPELYLNASNPSDAFGKWFLRFRLSIGVDRSTIPKVSFHSFRHSFREACRESEIPDYAAKRIGGWSAGSDQQSRYGKVDIAKLHAHLAKLQFPGLTLSHLHMQTP
jgi:integrase